MHDAALAHQTADGKLPRRVLNILIVMENEGAWQAVMPYVQLAESPTWHSLPANERDDARRGWA